MSEQQLIEAIKKFDPSSLYQAELIFQRRVILNQINIGDFVSAINSLEALIMGLKKDIYHKVLPLWNEYINEFNKLSQNTKGVDYYDTRNKKTTILKNTCRKYTLKIHQIITWELDEAGLLDKTKGYNGIDPNKESEKI